MKSGTPENRPVLLRDATADDAALLARLHTESSRSAYATLLDPHYLAREMEQERHAHWRAHLPAVLAGLGRIFIAERDGETLGFACVLRERDPDWGCYVDNLHVRPQLRGGGISKALLDAAVAWLRAQGESRAYLWVYEANHAARGFYERQGWRNAQQLPAKDAPGGDGLMCCRYVCDIAPAA
jgi:GNAT superfamily N-acetyltransferase